MLLRFLVVFYGIPVISAVDGFCLRIDTENEAAGGGRNLIRTNKIVIICLISTKANVITLQRCAKYYNPYIVSNCCQEHYIDKKELLKKFNFFAANMKSLHLAILFTPVLVMLTFANKKCFVPFDVWQNGFSKLCKRRNLECRAFQHPWDFFA